MNPHMQETWKSKKWTLIQIEGKWEYPINSSEISMHILYTRVPQIGSNKKIQVYTLCNKSGNRHSWFPTIKTLKVSDCNLPI